MPEEVDMKALVFGLFLILFLGCPLSVTLGEELITIHRGFLTGNDYLKLDKGEKISYVMGFFDGIMVAPIFKAPKSNMLWIESCLENMINVQVEAIVSKYLRDHPEVWHNPLHMTIYSAFKDACSR
jgi:hypothetical protein